MWLVERVPPVGLVVVAAALWGTTGTAQALGPDATTPLGIGLVRLLVGTVGLVVVAWPHRRAGGGGTVATLLGGVAVGCYQLSFFVGVDRLGVAVGTLVGIGSAPVLTGLGAALVDRDLGQLRWVARVAPLPVVGVALLVGRDLGSASLDPVGLVAALGAGASYAAYTLAARRLLDDGGASIVVMARLFAIGAVVLLAAVAVQGGIGLGWVGTGGGVAVAVWLGLVATTGAYVCFGAGLRTVAPARVATLSLTEPLVATMLGVVVLGERLAPVQVAGVVVVVAGLVLAGRVVVDTALDLTRTNED